jgi:Mrp family chromosome partitioning ATPase
MSTKPESTLADWMRVLLRRWRIVLAVVFVIVGLVVLRDLRSDPLYESTAEVFLTTQPERATGGLTRPYVDPDRLLQSELRFVKSQLVADAAAKRNGGPVPAVHAIAIGRSNLFTLSTRATSAIGAQKATVAYLSAYIELRSEQQRRGLVAALAELERSLTELESPSESASDIETQQQIRKEIVDLRVDLLLSDGFLQTVRSPSLPSNPVSPRPFLNGVLALFPALLLGALCAFLREALDETISCEEDVIRAMPELQTLGQVPRIRRGEPALTVRKRPEDQTAEAYRRIRANLNWTGGRRIILVTSAIRGEGKTTTTVNLAFALAESGQNVLLIDGDLRVQRLSRIMGTKTESAGDDSTPEWVSQHLSVLGAPRAAKASDIAKGAWLQSALDEAGDSYEIILVDAPPMLIASETTIFADIVDGTLLVVGAGIVSERQVRKALRQRGNRPALLGVIVNGVDRFETPGYPQY